MTDEQQPSRGDGTHAADGPETSGATRRTAGTGSASAEEAAGNTAAAGDAWGTADSGPGDADGTGAPRIRRSRKHKVLGGVCAGLGRHFDVDPVVFRVPLAVLSVVGGLGLIFYGCAWLLIPASGERENELRKLLSGRTETRSLAAFLIALVGCGLFLASLGSESTPFSLMLVAAVVGAAYWSRHRRQVVAAEAEGAPIDPTTAHAVAEAPPEAQAPPVRDVLQWWQDPLAKGGEGLYITYEGHHGAGSGTGYLWGPEELGDAEAAGLGAGAVTGVESRGPRHPARHQRQSIGGLVLLIALAAAAVGTAVRWTSQPLGTSLTVGLACALGVFGIGLVVSAFVGRLGGGTIAAVVITAVLLTGAAVLPKDIGTTQWDDRRWAPASATALRPEYRLDGGKGELDLRGVDVRAGQSVRTEARIGAGQLKVVVPEGVTVRLAAHVGAGEIRVPSGTTPDGRAAYEAAGGLDQQLATTLKPLDSSVKREGTIELKLKVGLGEGEIVRETPSGERSDRIPQGLVRAAALANSREETLR